MYETRIVCFKCKKAFPIENVIFECSDCGGPLDIEYDYDEIGRMIMRERFIRSPIKHLKYWMFYPINDLNEVVTLGEGGTPLVQSVNNENYFFKYEAANPTGSFKDRGSSIEITKAKEFWIEDVYCATTGNMGASVSAYSTRAGINANIFVPSDAPKSKILQIQSYGAKVKKVRGTYDDAFEATRKLRKEKGVYLTGDYPYRAEGEKSTGFEIIDQMNFQPPDQIVVPIGNGTHIHAIFKGLKEFKKVGLIKEIPKIIGIQARGCNPVYRAWKENLDYVPVVKKPKTIASAIECGNPVDGLKALYAIKRSGGVCEQVTDKEIKEAQIELGRGGIYAETSGAVPYAGAKKLKLEGKTVIVITGHGLKEK